MTYADDDTAEEWGDSELQRDRRGARPPRRGSDDEWSSDEEPEEVRTSDVGFRARFELVSRRDDDIAARSATRTKVPATRVDSETFTRTSDATTIRGLIENLPAQKYTRNTRADKTHNDMTDSP